ncbi:U1 like C2H2 zinc finger, related, related [Eimeria acervulina]|uniref:U1 like C2H2 zinc finger, related, related n=1 Tax=Eimeria acervulina TaxID=5801 RepID=U6GMK4_EIMAC|nr:U1 like C2H2 zinc finger, related, related [Eimeria acervulina]CDI81415.1 U1 like C2H2 zinc finger, related, related [Eimeria acervulina]
MWLAPFLGQLLIFSNLMLTFCKKLWCGICECLCKDSQAYLDHINGRNHNQLLGMSICVERVPLARVKAKLQAPRQAAGTGLEPPNPKTKADARAQQQQQQQQQGGGAQGTSGGFGVLAGGAGAEGGAAEADDEFERVQRRLEELQRKPALKKRLKKEKKRAAAFAAAGGTTPTAKQQHRQKQGWKRILTPLP